MAIKITADGKITEVHPKSEKGFTLEELQSAVGGHIELVRAIRPRTINVNGKEVDISKMEMWINEEGKLLELPLNLYATSIYRFGHDDAIVGDVLLTTTAYRKNEHGETEDYQF